MRAHRGGRGTPPCSTREALGDGRGARRRGRRRRHRQRGRQRLRRRAGASRSRAPATLGVVERGTGGDFIRTYGIPKKAERALRLLADGPHARASTSAALTCQAADGSGELTRLFANIALVRPDRRRGRRARTARPRSSAAPPRSCGRRSTTFAAWKNVAFHIELDGDVRDMVANNVICVNGRQLGGGIKIAPQAEPDDGLFDVVVIGDVGKAALARNVHRMYLGTLHKDPRVELKRVARVSRHAGAPAAGRGGRRAARHRPRCASRCCRGCSTCSCRPEPGAATS